MKQVLGILAAAIVIATAGAQPVQQKFFVWINVPFVVDGQQRSILYMHEHATADEARRRHANDDVQMIVYGQKVDPVNPGQGGRDDNYYLCWIGKPDGRNDEMYVRGFGNYEDMRTLHRQESAKEGYQFRACVRGVEIVLKKSR